MPTSQTRRTSVLLGRRRVYENLEPWAKHDDPADRFIAATASVYQLTLVTADERLLRGKGYETIRA